MEKQLPHILLTTQPDTLGYTSPQSGGVAAPTPVKDRPLHGTLLKTQFEKAWESAQAELVQVKSSKEGFYIEFISNPDLELLTKSLEDLRSKQIRLLNIRTTQDDQGQFITLATVFVHRSKKDFFIKKLEEYLTQDTPKGNPKNEALINSIAAIKHAIGVEPFWTDADVPIPTDAPEWIEVWLSTTNQDSITSFDQLLIQHAIPRKTGQITFPERTVIVIFANAKTLTLLQELSDFIAEYRKAKTTSSFFTELQAKDQLEWVHNIEARLKISEAPYSSICIFDTGVNNGHPLIKPLLHDNDCRTVDADWGSHDHYQHGTLMAGTALYGNLTDVLDSTASIEIPYVLESVKILPKNTSTPTELWGYMTASAVEVIENTAPARKRTFCMAVAATETRERGRPSSWSATIDQLASEWSNQRLFIICAGNSVASMDFEDAALQYPDIQLTESVHDPAQSWNAITVGAITNLSNIQDPDLQAYTPVALPNTLSPFSTTSTTWEENKWPIKPELVLEGGNLAIDETGFATECDDLSILSTTYKPSIQGYFAPFNMTSAATAQLAKMAGTLRAMYPEYWEETIRALLIHSAEWPEALKKQFLERETKNDFKTLLKICGYGVPNLNRALYSASNSLTLISQAELQPFEKNGSTIKTSDMHYYELPWPKEALESLPDTAFIKMKVTLSYFIEPGPGEIGWKDRYRYPSHVLRFDLNNPSETKSEFLKRINKQQQAESEDNNIAKSSSASKFWLLGSNARDRGSIHSDTWSGTAAELAASNFIAIMPKTGWWKERKHLNMYERKTRYSLIVSIETTETDVDIYTPVINQINVPIAINT